MTEEGFERGRSDNLPKVDSFMVAEFLSSTPLFFSAEIRGVKAKLSGRSSYGDASVGYVQVKREGSIYTIKAKICLEHKVRSKNYNVSLKVHELEEKVQSVTCHDCPASLGGCKHAIAFAMWVHRRSEEPAVTEVEYYWKKSKLAGVGNTIKYITSNSFGKIHLEQAQNLSSGNFLNEFVQKDRERQITSEIMKYYIKDESLNKLGIYQMLREFVTTGATTANEFLMYASSLMQESDCKLACNSTVEQSGCKLWQQLRYGRITASRLYEAARCKTGAGVLVEQIVGSSRTPETKAMIRGKLLEKKIIHAVEEKLKIKLQPTGLLLSSEKPFPGASPDSVSDDYVVEVKCPTTIKTLASYVKDNVISNKFKSQINLQMYLFKKRHGIFCVASPSFEINSAVDIYNVELDVGFIESLIDCAEEFWKQNIFPVLLKSFKHE